MARCVLNMFRAETCGIIFRLQKNSQSRNDMDPLTTLSLASIGERVAGRIIGAVEGITTSAQSSSATSFDSALATAKADAANPYSGMEKSELVRSLASIETKLSDDADVKAFTGGKSFRILQKDGGLAIRRADGQIWQIPADSDTAKLAESLSQCHVALDNARGIPTTGLRSEWMVKGSADEDAASLLKAC